MECSRLPLSSVLFAGVLSEEEKEDRRARKLEVLVDVEAWTSASLYWAVSLPNLNLAVWA